MQLILMTRDGLSGISRLVALNGTGHAWASVPVPQAELHLLPQQNQKG